MKINIAIAINTNILLFKNEEDLFLNEENPHLEHTILPPKDRSETNEELPQLKQTLFTLIKKNFKQFYLNYIAKYYVKKNFKNHMIMRIYCNKVNFIA